MLNDLPILKNNYSKIKNVKTKQLLKNTIIAFITAFLLLAGHNAKAQGASCIEATVVTPSNNISTDSTTNWYIFTPTETALYKIKTPAYLYVVVLKGNCDSYQPILLVQNNQSGSFYAEQGTTYYLMSASSTASPTVWQLEKEASSTGMVCRTAKIIDTLGSYSINSQSNYWYSFTASQEGVHKLHTTADMSLNVYDSCNGNNINYGANFYALQGETYYIHWHNHTTASQTWTINKPNNPEGLMCQTARDINPSGNIQANQGYNWYTFTPTTEQKGWYTINSSMVVSTGDCHNLNPLTISNEMFYAEIDTTYYILYNNASGKNQTWNLEKSNIESLFCETAKAITPSSNIQANTQKDNWYTFTPTVEQKGWYYINPIPYSTYYYSIYTGNCTDLKLITSNNVFFAEAGVTYYINYRNLSGGNHTWNLELISTEISTCETAKAIIPSNNIQANAYGYNWYTFSPSAEQEGVYRISYNSSALYTTVYTGYCNSLTSLTIPDNIFYAKAGTTYYIRYENYSGTNHTWNLIKEANPEGMFCETAKDITFTNNIPVNAQFFNWYTFTPTTEQEGAYLINYPMAIRIGNCNIFESVNISNSLFYAEAGTTYYILYYNLSGISNTWNLEKANIEGLYCKTPKTINNTGSYQIGNQGDYWYAFTPTQNGVYSLYTNADMSVEVLDSCNGTNINYGPNFYATSGETYYIHWHNYTTASQTWTLSKPSNPEGFTCETAKNITSCNNVPANIQGYSWYTFTPTEEQADAYFINSSLSVSVGSCNNLKPVHSSKNVFYAEAGKTYYIAYYNTSGTSKTWSLPKVANPPYVTNIRMDTCPPPISIGEEISIYHQLNGIYTVATWESRNNDVATASTSGKVKGVTAGQTYIILTVTAANVILKDSCLVTVTSPIKEPEINVVPQANAILITWPKENNASNYTLILFSDAERTQVIGTYEFDSEGKLLTKEATYSHTVTGLTAETHYYYSLTAYNENQQEIKTIENDFTTLKATGIKEANVEEVAFVIYPNPVTSGELTIESGGFGTAIQLFDLNGKCVGTFASSGEKTEINIGHLPSGTYLVKMGNTIRKITKR